MSAMIDRITGTTANVTMSIVLTPKRNPDRSRPPNAATMSPMAMPAATSRIPSPTTSAITSRLAAPSAIRMPISRVRLAIENASPYGNAASIYTTSGATARYFEQHASAGMIGVNIGVPVPREPFSFGGWNDSRFGMGDITGTDGISFWTKLKKTTTKWTARAGQNWMS